MKSSDKLVSVLRLFSMARPAWSVEDASAELRLPQSTTYEYFRSLAEAGLIAPADAGRYVLGPAVIEMDRISRASDPLLVGSRSALDVLVDRSPVPIVGLLCRLYRLKVMCVDQRASEAASFAVSYERGRLMPLFRGAASKVILANIERRRVRRFYDDNGDGVSAAGMGTDWPGFRLHLRRIRSERVFITRGELDPGRIGISVALLGASGYAYGSLSIVADERDYDRDAETRAELLSRLVRAADRVQEVVAI